MQHFVRLLAVAAAFALVGGCSQCGKTSARGRGDVAEVSVGSGH